MMINDHKFVMRFIPKKAEQAAQTAQDLTVFLFSTIAYTMLLQITKILGAFIACCHSSIFR